VVDSLPGQCFPHILEELSLQFGLQSLNLRVKFKSNIFLDGLNDSLLEQISPGSLIQERFPQGFIIKVEVDGWRFDGIL
jgi:hypothetical protein